MSDRDPEGQGDAEPTEPPSDADLAIILGGDPDAVTTTSHDIIKSGFDDSLTDDADDVALVPAKPIASPRVGEQEHVVPSVRRRWWFSRHHHRESDTGGRGVEGSGDVDQSVGAPRTAAASSSSGAPAAADPLAWLQAEPKPHPRSNAKPELKPKSESESKSKPELKPKSESESKSKPESKSETDAARDTSTTERAPADAAPGDTAPADTPSPDAPPAGTAAGAAPAHETRASLRAKRRE